MLLCISVGSTSTVLMTVKFLTEHSPLTISPYNTVRVHLISNPGKAVIIIMHERRLTVLATWSRPSCVASLEQFCVDFTVLLRLHNNHMHLRLSSGRTGTHDIASARRSAPPSYFVYIVTPYRKMRVMIIVLELL